MHSGLITVMFNWKERNSYISHDISKAEIAHQLPIFEMTLWPDSDMVLNESPVNFNYKLKGNLLPKKSMESSGAATRDLI